MEIAPDFKVARPACGRALVTSGITGIAFVEIGSARPGRPAAGSSPSRRRRYIPSQPLAADGPPGALNEIAAGSCAAPTSRASSRTTGPRPPPPAGSRDPRSTARCAASRRPPARSRRCPARRPRSQDPRVSGTLRPLVDTAGRLQGAARSARGCSADPRLAETLGDVRAAAGACAVHRNDERRGVAMRAGERLDACSGTSRGRGGVEARRGRRPPACGTRGGRRPRRRPVGAARRRPSARCRTRCRGSAGGRRAREPGGLAGGQPVAAAREAAAGGFPMRRVSVLSPPRCSRGAAGLQGTPPDGLAGTRAGPAAGAACARAARPWRSGFRDGPAFRRRRSRPGKGHRAGRSPSTTAGRPAGRDGRRPPREASGARPLRRRLHAAGAARRRLPPQRRGAEPLLGPGEAGSRPRDRGLAGRAPARCGASGCGAPRSPCAATRSRRSSRPPRRPWRS